MYSNQEIQPSMELRFLRNPENNYNRKIAFNFPSNYLMQEALEYKVVTQILTT